jgi:hypothetical protein
VTERREDGMEFQGIQNVVDCSESQEAVQYCESLQVRVLDGPSS